MKRETTLLMLVAGMVIIGGWLLGRVFAQTGETFTFLPLVTRSVPEPTPMVEMRGLWVTRFDWTLDPGGVTPAKLDEIVNNAASAGFNALFFQVRGEADAFYASNYEPWSKLLTGTLGQNPGWDPLEYIIQKAHARGLQVHAYINVYPVWLGCTPPPDNTTPRHFYYQLRDEYGTTDGKPNGLQWDTDGNVICDSYLRASPASLMVDDHLLDVAADLVTRYDLDGLHLDHARYALRDSSCDPVSEAAYGADCFSNNGSTAYDDWQRQQVNATIAKFYEQIVPLKPGMWLTAAVWPIYIDYWGWGGTQGYYDFYQDSKAWLAEGDMDALMPMIYGGSFWTQARFETLTADFQASRNGRYIIPGIGADFDDFSEIEARINMARAAGTAGHAIFSYSALLAHGYFDDLAAGPYAETAVVPDLPWRASGGE
ncbi:MAG: family 10 glycosylhydrolase [Ardenticatenaceae bacterium]|nr:family 10 glycosylhydrolase [Ardenticatenaceae bacterium]